MLKELRETAWIALVALVAQLAFVANDIGYPILPTGRANSGEAIPFLDSDFLSHFCLVSIALAVALGIRQTVFEANRGTWLFLLQRPISLRRVILAKLLVGGGLYLLCGSFAILSYAAWAAMPGKHASPFYWWMTGDSWMALWLIAIIYLGAVLTGIRPARWFGTRLLPVVASGVFAAVLIPSMFWPMLGIVALVLVAAGFVSLIDFTVGSRDFS
jgi:hypothetical protein